MSDLYCTLRATAGEGWAASTTSGFAVNKGSDQGYAHVQGDEQQILNKCRALIDALLDGVRFGSL